MSTEVEKVAIYIGRRTLQGGKLGHGWIFLSVNGETTTEEEARYWTKQIAPAVIGQRYQFHVTLKDDGSVSVHTGGKNLPKPVGNYVLDNRHSEWSAVDAASKQMFDHEKALKSVDKNNNDFQRALNPIRDMLLTLRTHDERYAFIKKVESELWRSNRGK